jgi:cysteine-rich repeat protein
MNTRDTAFTIHRRLGLAGALALGCWSGGTSGCTTGSLANPDHCFHAEGDRSCQEWLGSELGYCLSPESSCGDEPQAERGCVAERPPAECHSPCGAGLVASEDPDCSAAADDESSGDGDGDGDGDESTPPVCGDGIIEGDEECDDGNTIDDDECSNACVAARCGDGIVQLAAGELCDDGNVDWGDACTAECRPPGELVWSRTYEIGDCYGADVVVATTGELRVSARCEGGDWRLLGLDPDGELQWNYNGVDNGRKMALGADDYLILGGSINDQGGHLRYFSEVGGYQWHYYLYGLTDSISDVAFAPSGDIFAAGEFEGDVVVQRVTAAKELVWSHQGVGGELALALGVNAQEHARVLQGAPLQVLEFGPDGSPVWASSMFAETGSLVGDLAIDSEDRTYAIWQTSWTGFSLTRLDSLGETVWVSEHNLLGVDEICQALAVLPSGMVLVASYTQAAGIERDAVLTWFSADGEIVHEVVLDGPAAIDGDSFHGVAVSPEGYGVAVGAIETDAGPSLWLVRFTL